MYIQPNPTTTMSDINRLGDTTVLKSIQLCDDDVH